MFAQADVAPKSARVAQWLQQHVFPGSRVIDIGANGGDYTSLIAALAGMQGHVHAFEPAPANVARLRVRCAGLTNVSIHENAVGESTRNVRFYLDADNDTQHSLGSHNVGRAGGCLKVRQVALRLSKFGRVLGEDQIHTFLADPARWEKIDIVAIPRSVPGAKAGQLD